MTAEEQQALLKKGTVLQDKYRIDDYLASGGFGNTYIVTHIALNRQYAMKEFFVRGINHREQNNTTIGVSNSENVSIFNMQRGKFLIEAQRLSQLDNEHIVRVHDLFEENNTAYYVMDFIKGSTLSEIMKRQNGPFAEDKVKDIATQMLDALNAIHAMRIYHMDLKPDNIIMGDNGKCVLIDFGSSKQTSEANGVKTATAVTYTQGFAPPEQITGVSEKWGPATDYYALGATMYNLLTNKKPPAANDIIDDAEAAFVYPLPVGANMRQLVKKLMAPSTSQRPKNIAEIKELLELQDQTPVAPVATPPSISSSEETQLSVANNVSNQSSEETIVGGMAGSQAQPTSPTYSVPPSGQPQGPVPPPQKPAERKGMGGGMKALIIILTALVVGGIGVGLYFLLKGDNSSSTTTEQTNTEKNDSVNVDEPENNDNDEWDDDEWDDDEWKKDDNGNTDDEDDVKKDDPEGEWEVVDPDDPTNKENEESIKIFKQYVGLLKSQCPQRVDNGMELSDTWLDDETWVLVFTLKDNIYKELLTEVNYNKEQAQKEMMDVLTQDENFKMMVDMCRKNNRDVAFWFKSKTTKKIIKFKANLRK